MRVFLVQHGVAKADSEDPGRPLTDAGRGDVQAVARAAASLGVQPHRIVHSEKLRARQTAEIFATQLEPAGGVEEEAGIAPKDDPVLARERLLEAGAPVMLVGHLPHLSRLAALMVTGDGSRDIVVFRNGGVVCLEGGGGEVGWKVEWVLTPELALRITRTTTRNGKEP